jgi:hypothetical protein
MTNAPRFALATLLLAAALACGDRGIVEPPLVFSPDTLPAAQVGQAYAVAISVSGNDTPVASMQVEGGVLPAGVVLAHQSAMSEGQLAGTPTEAGTFAFTIRAACFGTNHPGQEGSKVYVLVVR